MLNISPFGPTRNLLEGRSTFVGVTDTLKGLVFRTQADQDLELVD
jgi:hypothetical protein